MRVTRSLAALACGVGLLALCPSSSRAADPALSTQTVDALNAVFGKHPGFRANHAKGVVVSGHFKATPEAATLSRAALFSGQDVPLTARFSNSTGVPDLPDGDPNANPHGLAMKFHVPGGRDVDMVINSLKFFPVKNGEEFRDLLRAIAASPPSAAKPTKMDEFVAAHPTLPAALATVATPDSFADEEYHGVDAFVFVDKAGHRQPFRLLVTPEHLVHLSSADAAAKGPDFLMQELPARLAKGPVTFRMRAQLADPGDQTADPSKPWPDDRKVVDLGVITLDKAAEDNATAQRRLLFLPTNLADGIELSDDPLVGARTGAYAVSYARRLK